MESHTWGKVFWGQQLSAIIYLDLFAMVTRTYIMYVSDDSKSL